MTLSEKAGTTTGASESGSDGPQHSEARRDAEDRGAAGPEADGPEPDDDEETTDWYESRIGRYVVVTYLLGTVAGVFVAVNEVGDLPLLSTDDAGVHPVPGYVFLYAFMGASAYAVTSLVENEKSSREVVKLGLRVFAALPLALGVWAFAPFVGFGEQPRVVAGVAFLAGLYVNLALKTFGSLAERLLTAPGSR